MNEGDCENGKGMENTYDEQLDESDYDPSGRPESEGERVEDEPASSESASSTYLIPY